MGRNEDTRQAPAKEKKCLPGERPEPSGTRGSCPPQPQPGRRSRNLYARTEGGTRGCTRGRSPSSAAHAAGPSVRAPASLCTRCAHSVKPSMCPECSKTSTTDSSCLLMHQRSHTGKRPCECSECGKAFTCSSDLPVPQGTHGGEKPHHCTQCPVWEGIWPELPPHLSPDHSCPEETPADFSDESPLLMPQGFRSNTESK